MAHPIFCCRNPAGLKKKPAKPVSPTAEPEQPTPAPAPTASPDGDEAEPAPTATPASTPETTPPPVDLGRVSIRVSCVGTSCEFFTADQGDNVSYAWSFGDGNTANTRIASYIYASPEDYRVRLQTSSAEGHRSSEFSLEVGTANKPCSDCQAAQGVIASGDTVTLPEFSTAQERDIMAWLRGPNDSYHRAILQRNENGQWRTVGRSIGDDDDQILIANESPAGTYRVRLSSDTDAMRYQVWTRAK